MNWNSIYFCILGPLYLTYDSVYSGSRCGRSILSSLNQMIWSLVQKLHICNLVSQLVPIDYSKYWIYMGLWEFAKVITFCVFLKLLFCKSFYLLGREKLDNMVEWNYKRPRSKYALRGYWGGVKGITIKQKL